jgi:amidophosphoribosyltransferase
MNSNDDDKLHEACGVFGVFCNDPQQDAAPLVYYGLFSLQHRGQECAGIAAVKDNQIEVHKGMGLVGDIFEPGILSNI